MIVPLFDFFAPLLWEGVTVALFAVEDVVSVAEECDVLGAGVVANFATVVVNACPTCPEKVVSAGMGLEVAI